jgi:hypothetical protein
VAAIDDTAVVDVGAEVDTSMAPGAYQTTLTFTAIGSDDPIAAPTIDGLAPTLGSVNGGTVVTISGSNFMVNGSVVVYDVRAGGVTCELVNVISASALECTIPPHDEGAELADVVVKTWGGEVTLTDGFEYIDTGEIAPPVIVSADEPCVTPLVGNTVTINYPEGTGYYRLDDDPTWTAYTSPITVSETTFVYAKAIDGTSESKIVEFIALVAERTDEKFICNEADLRAVSANASWTYYMVNDVGLTSAWTSIPDFSGKFYGRDKTIDNMNFTANTNRGFINTIANEGVVLEGVTFTNVAIAGNIAGKGTVVGTVSAADFGLRNVRVEGGVISGNTNNNYANVGGLIGEVSNGDGSLSISDCHVDADITGRYYLGGLVGKVAIGKAISITRCGYSGTLTDVATGTTTGYDGGLIGQGSNATITDCYMDGTIVATAAPNMGGIAGGLEGVNTLSGIDITGSVAGKVNTGGVVGVLTGGGNKISEVTITGSVSGTAPVGGVVGLSNGGDLEIDQVEFITTAGVAGAGTSVGGIAGDLYGSNTIKNVNLDLTTGITGGSQTGGLVGRNISVLTVENASIATNISASSSVGGVVGITSGGNFSNITIERGDFTVGNSSGGLVGSSSEDLVISDIEIKASKIDLGSSSSAIGGLIGSASSGVDIDGVTVARNIVGTAGANRGGLIGYINVTDTAKTVTIKNCTVTGNVLGTTYVGGVVGRLTRAAGVNTDIDNCHYSGELSVGTTPSGGLVGAVTAGDISITGSSANVTISGSATTNAGGLVGSGVGGVTITNSQSSGSITATGANIGGLLGTANGAVSVTGSSSSATISATVAGAGGLIGAMTAGSIEISGSSSSSNVTNTAGNVGGLVGSAAVKTTIDGSFATGTIKGGTNAGGLVGTITGASSSIKNSYATGNVSGTTYIGGLAGAVAGNSTQVTNSYATGNASGASYVGGLIGNFSTTATNGGVLNRSYARGNVTATATYVGGLVGNTAAAVSEVYASGNVTNNNSATASTPVYTGGLIGQLAANGSLTNAYALGDVSLASSSLNNVGGLVGYTRGNITNAYSAGSVAFVGTANINAVVGVRYNATIVLTNLYWVAETATIYQASADAYATMLTWAATPLADYVGFDPGVWDNQDGVTVPYFQNLTLDPKNYIDNLRRYNFDGSGSLADPYQIKNETDLAHVYTTPFANYKVMNDFAMTQAMSTIPELIDGGIDGGGHTITGFTNSGQGLIGSISNPAVYIKDLTFDSATISGSSGNKAVVLGTLATAGDYTLDNVNVTNSTISGASSNVAGLIGAVTGAGGTLTVSNCAVSGAIGGASYVGGLVGMASSNKALAIDSCHYAGALTASGSYAGGLVGQTAAGDLSISSSYSTGTLAAAGYGGGLVGAAIGGTALTSVISESYSTSNITGGSTGYFGGIAGNINTGTASSVSRVYASGNVSCSLGGSNNSNTGGLVGAASNVGFENVYALGNVSASTTGVGGLIGSVTGGTITNAYSAGASTGAATLGTISSPTITNLYWQVDTSHIQSDANANAQPIRTLYQPSSTYAGFDFGSVWDMTQGSTIPYFQDLTADSKNYITTIRRYDFAGRGLSDDPYLVNNYADFNEMRNNQHAYYKLTADIDLTGLAQLPDIWYGGIDGAGHTVSNFTLSAAGTAGGLFSVLSHPNVTIKNLTLESFSLVGTANTRGLLAGQITATGVMLDNVNVENGTLTPSSGNRTNYGGLIGQITTAGGATIKDCNVTINIAGSQYIGGLVGQANNLDISGSTVSLTNSVPIAGASYIGGLVGSLTTGSITNSSASGLGFSLTSAYSGGIAGVINGVTVTNSHSTIGNIASTVAPTSNAFLGGLVGDAIGNSTISQSSATTNISGSSYVGGLVGRLYTSQISGSFATGDITARGSHSGGLVGYVYTSSVADSYATGNVTLTSSSVTSLYAGGLTGQASTGPITRSFARGNVSVSTGIEVSTVHLGGLVGHSQVTVSESYASGNVSYAGSTVPYIGGLIGYSNGANAVNNNVYSLGNVTTNLASPNLGGIIGNLQSSSKINQAYSVGKVVQSGILAVDKSVFGTKAGTATNIYWLTETSGVFTDPYALPIYLASQPASDYVGFDFGTIWDKDDTTVPYFQNVTIDPKNYINNLGLHNYDGSGTEIDPYLLKNASDVDAMRENPFAYYKADNDIDMSGYGAIFPIPMMVTGGIDGNNKTISNISLTGTAANVGLFATIIGDVVIKDLTLDNISYAGGSYANVGGLAGTVSTPNFTLDNVNVTGGQITTTGVNTGGLIGYYSAPAGVLTVSGCDISATLNARDYVGGIVGRADVSSEVIISDCSFSGSIANNNDYRGGFVGGAGKVTMSDVGVTGAITGSDYIGGLAGDIQGGSVNNASVSGSDLTASNNRIGGLIGRNTLTSLNISDILVSKNIALSATSNYVGGLVGSIAGTTGSTGQIQNAIMTGNIVAATAMSYVGGLVGESQASIAMAISQSYSSGNITHTTGTYIGGLLGYSAGDTLQDVYSLAIITGTGANAGGLIGSVAGGVSVTNAYATGKTSNANATRQATVGLQSGTNSFANVYWNVEASNIFEDSVGKPIATLYNPPSDYAGFDFASVWDMIQDSATPQYSLPYLRNLTMPANVYIDSWVDYTYVGKGLAADPYEIYTNDDLSNIRNNPYAFYKVMNDLSPSANWTTIPKIYAGAIDGQNHTLSGLTVAATSTATNGFINNIVGDFNLHDWQINNFSTTGNSAQKGFIANVSAGNLTIDNLDFVGGSIAPVTAQANTGALIGQINGANSVTITDITSTMSVKGSTNTGGLIGSATIAGNLTLSDIDISGPVAVTSTAGGVVGTLAVSGTANLSNVQFTDSLTVATAGTIVGGIIGTITTGTVSMSNITQTSNISSTNGTLGGYIGSVTSATTAVSIDGGTMTGTVTATSGGFIGGIIGTSATTNSTTLKNLTINRTDGTGAITGTSYVGGAIGGVSAGDLIIENVNSNYNIVGGTTTTTYVGGLVGQATGAFSASIKNSSSSGDVTGARYLGGLAGALTMTGANLTTIENSHATGKTINSNGDNTYRGGLVGALSGGSITGSSATGDVTGTTSIGGLVGSSATNALNITNSSATGNITSSGTSGGLVGTMAVATSSISSSHATGNITSTGTVNGGLVGTMAGGSISNSYATGTVKGTTTLGGLLGSSTANAITISGSYAEGDIDSTGISGGLAGSIAVATSSITSSHATGDITSTGATNGGLVGTMVGGSITDSYAEGSVEGTSTLGGLLGSSTANTITISNSYAIGDVTGTTGTLGGLAGSIASASSSVTLSYATGNVTSTGTLTGGLIGSNYAILSKVYASGDVINNNASATAANLYVGGLVGRHYTTLVSNAFAVGNVTTPIAVAHTNIGGLVGNNNSGTFTNIYYGGVLNGTIGTPASRQMLVGSTLPAATTGAYWYSDISGYAGTTTNATAVTQSSTQSDFVGFDFTSIWDMTPGVTMPYLLGLPFNNKVQF